MVLALDGHVEPHAGKQRPAPGPGGGHDDGCRDLASVGLDAGDAPARDPECRGACLRPVDHAHLARPLQEVVGDAGAVSVARARLPGGERDIVHVPVGHDSGELVACHDARVHAVLALHGDVLLEAGEVALRDDAHEARLPEIAVAPHVVLPLAKNLEAFGGEVDLGRKAVVHPDERGGATARPAGDVPLVEHQNAAGPAARQVERDRGAHDAGAQDHVVGRPLPEPAHATRRLRSSSARCAALCPGAPVTPPPGWAPAPQRYRPSIGVR